MLIPCDVKILYIQITCRYAGKYGSSKGYVGLASIVILSLQVLLTDMNLKYIKVEIRDLPAF